MRILLDACVPRRLAHGIAGHEVSTAHDMGWGDLDDGPLLDAAADTFDAFVTVDKGIPAQQKLDLRPFAIIILRAKSNRLGDLRPLLNELHAVLQSAEPGQVYEIPQSAPTTGKRQTGQPIAQTIDCPGHLCAIERLQHFNLPPMGGHDGAN